LGLAVTFTAGFFVDPELPLLILALIVGIVAATGAPLTNIGAYAGGMLAGFLIGIVSTPEPGSLGAIVATVVGNVGGAMLLPLFVAGGVVALREWDISLSSIASRIAASWIATISALLVAVGFAR
jgi:hypothetical protein